MAEVTLDNVLEFDFLCNNPMRKATDPDVDYHVGDPMDKADLEAMGAKTVLYLLENNALLLKEPSAASSLADGDGHPAVDSFPAMESEDEDEADGGDESDE